MSGISEKSNLQKISLQELQRLIALNKQIENIEILDEVFIDSSNYDTLSFFNCKFSALRINVKLERLTIGKCDFDELNISNDIKHLSLFNLASEKGTFSADNISISNFHISNCILKEISLGQIGKVSVTELFCFQSVFDSFLLHGTFKKVFFNHGNKIHSSLFDGKIENLEIVHFILPNKKIDINEFVDFVYYNEAEKGILKVQKANIKNLFALGQHVDSFFEFTETSIENISFNNDFGPNGTIKIKTCNDLSKISFNSANVANLEIFNSNFSNTTFISDQSIFEKIKWQSVEWSEALERYRNSENNHVLNDSFRRETLRVLKLNAQLQQDTVNYIRFHALEQQAYKIQIKTKKWYDGDRILLFLNTISNNHGLSWGRGVIFSIGVALVFFILNSFFLNNPHWEFGWSNWPDFWRVAGTTIKLFSQSLYAAHSFDYLNDYNPKGIVFLLDLIGRIFLTYGYYQTIVAFRKFGRK